MGKTKPQTNGKVSKHSKAASPVKDAGVKKTLQQPAMKAKELAKTAAAKLLPKEEKKSKKSKKVEPEPESESSISDSPDDESESEDEVAPAPINGVKDDDSEDEDEDDSDESEDEKPAVKASKMNGTVAKADTDDSSEGGSDDDDEAAPQANGDSADDTSDESESSDDEEDETPAKAKAANGVAEDDDDEDSSDEEEEEEPAPSKKRKADVASTPAPKKTKTDDAAAPSSGEGIKNLFVGGLSWNVDEEWFAREFEEFGEVVGARIITDHESGRSKGYGYIEFADAESAAKALAAKHETMIDGRQVRVDFSTPRQPRDGATPRDRTNQRASKFGDQQGNPSETLFCGNLSFDCTNDVVSEAFGEFGTITSVRLPTDRETGNPKGFGYISFSTVDEAKAAFEAMNGEEIAGRRCRLDYAQPRDESGGGRGGRGGFGDRGGRGRGGFGDRGGRGRGGFGDRGGRGRGGFGDRGGRGRGGFTTNRGGFGDFKGNKVSFD